MGNSTSTLVQSKYFSACFNMAVFDGPFRLYFTQSQESAALKLYFELHEKIGHRMDQIPTRGPFPKTLFVLMYPDETIMNEAMGTAASCVVQPLDDHTVIGILGPDWRDEVLPLLCEEIEGLVIQSSQMALPEIHS